MSRTAVPAAMKRARNPRSGSRASSDRTRVDILEAAKQVLAAQGYARFTLRQVASTAHISLGNLVYHYASKRDLMRALITQLMIDYRSRIDTFLHASTWSQSNDFASLVEWLIVDSVSPATSRLFRELWALALRDDFIATAVNQFYDEMHATAAARLKENFPELTKQSALEIAHLMGIISEGANVLYGTTTRNQGTQLKRTVKLAASLLVKAAERS